MRCDEVMQELSAPSGGFDPSALAAHLSDCPQCASWSAQVEKLDHIWADTRPDEFSGAAFDAIWEKAVAAASQPEVIPFAPSPVWERWGKPLIAVAQAAGIL